MSEQVKFGKIKVYGRVIDLDNTQVEELKKMKIALDKRLKTLCDKYAEMYSNENE